MRSSVDAARTSSSRRDRAAQIDRPAAQLGDLDRALRRARVEPQLGRDRRAAPVELDAVRRERARGEPRRRRDRHSEVAHLDRRVVRAARSSTGLARRSLRAAPRAPGRARAPILIRTRERSPANSRAVPWTASPSPLIVEIGARLAVRRDPRLARERPAERAAPRAARTRPRRDSARSPAKLSAELGARLATRACGELGQRRELARPHARDRERRPRTSRALLGGKRSVPSACAPVFGDLERRARARAVRRRSRSR